MYDTWFPGYKHSQSHVRNLYNHTEFSSSEKKIRTLITTIYHKVNCVISFIRFTFYALTLTCDNFDCPVSVFPRKVILRFDGTLQNFDDKSNIFFRRIYNVVFTFIHNVR